MRSTFTAPLLVAAAFAAAVFGPTQVNAVVYGQTGEYSDAACMNAFSVITYVGNGVCPTDGVTAPCAVRAWGSEKSTCSEKPPTDLTFGITGSYATLAIFKGDSCTNQSNFLSNTNVVPGKCVPLNDAWVNGQVYGKAECSGAMGSVKVYNDSACTVAASALDFILDGSCKTAVKGAVYFGDAGGVYMGSCSGSSGSATSMATSAAPATTTAAPATSAAPATTTSAAAVTTTSKPASAAKLSGSLVGAALMIAGGMLAL